MTVRRATLADRATVVAMLRAAHAAGGLPFPFSAPHAVSLFDGCMTLDSRVCIILEADSAPHGVLMASAQDHPFSPVKFAAEIVWWIDPEYRGGSASEMLAEYEAWAARAGCAFVAMAALAAAPRAGVIYRRRGYVEAETHFLKSI